MLCQNCEKGRHYYCNLATWCDCECEGPSGIYFDDSFSEMSDEEWYYFENPEGT